LANESGHLNYAHLLKEVHYNQGIILDVLELCDPVKLNIVLLAQLEAHKKLSHTLESQK